MAVYSSTTSIEGIEAKSPSIDIYSVFSEKNVSLKKRDSRRILKFGGTLLAKLRGGSDPEESVTHVRQRAGSLPTHTVRDSRSAERILEARLMTLERRRPGYPHVEQI
jgi:hypothetical protein